MIIKQLTELRIFCNEFHYRHDDSKFMLQIEGLGGGGGKCAMVMCTLFSPGVVEKLVKTGLSLPDEECC